MRKPAGNSGRSFFTELLFVGDEIHSILHVNRISGFHVAHFFVRVAQFRFLQDRFKPPMLRLWILRFCKPYHLLTDPAIPELLKNKKFRQLAGFSGIVNPNTADTLSTRKDVPVIRNRHIEFAGKRNSSTESLISRLTFQQEDALPPHIPQSLFP